MQYKKLHRDKAVELIKRASVGDIDNAERSHLMRQAMLAMIVVIDDLADQLVGKKAGIDEARAILREARTLSARSLRALKSADAALSKVLAWERTYYAPEEKEAMRDVELSRRKIRRLIKPGQFVEDESAADDDGEQIGGEK